MTRHRLLVFVYFILFSVLTAAQTPRFSHRASYADQPITVGGFSLGNAVSYSSGGSWPDSLVVVDVNGDSKPDMMILDGCTANGGCSGAVVAVRLGNGDGTFGPETTYDTGAFTSASLAVADVNGDGKLDLLVADTCATSDCSGPGMVSALLGNGDGTFQPAVLYPSGGNQASALALVDVNADGKPDLIVLNYCVSGCMNLPSGNPSSFVSVLLGNGDGTFQGPVNYGTGGSGPAALVVADVNGDGKPDLVVSNCGMGDTCSSGGVGLLLGNGDGSFQNAVSYSSGGASAGALAVKDVNGDGKPDLLVLNVCTLKYADCSQMVAGVLLNNGDGTFQSAVTYGVGGLGGGALEVADVDGDGQPDLIVGIPCQVNSNDCLFGVSNSFLSVLLGNGGGTFRTPIFFNIGGYGPDVVIAADLNGDAKPDLLVANRCDTSVTNCTTGSIGVIMNNSLRTGTGATTATLVSSQDPSTFGQSVTFVATIAPQSAGIPSGTIGFGSDGSFLQYAPVGSDGVATLTTSTLPVARHNITAAYYGDANFAPSASGVEQVVQGGIAQLSSDSLNFGTQAYGLASNPLSITLTNPGSLPLVISAISVAPEAPAKSTAGFFETNNCPASMAPNAVCTINVTFTPTAYGTAGALLSIADNAADPQQSIQLLGTTDFVLSAPSINFPAECVGSPSAPQTLTITNSGTTAAPIASVTASISDFTVHSACGTSLASGASCSITLGFNPTAGGPRSGTLMIATSTQAAVPQTVPLSGAAQDFSLSVASGSSSATVHAGQAANYSLSLAAIGGFQQTVNLTCAGIPSGATCSVAPNSLTLDSTTPSPIVVTISTAGNTARLTSPAGSPPSTSHVPLWMASSGLSSLVLLGCASTRVRSRKRLLAALLALGLVSVIVIASACGGGSNGGGNGGGGGGGGGTPSGTYPITVTAGFSSGSTTLNHSTTLTLIVNP